MVGFLAGPTPGHCMCLCIKEAKDVRATGIINLELMYLYLPQN